MRERAREIALATTLATAAVFTVGACDANSQPKDTVQPDKAPTIMEIIESPNNRIPEAIVLGVIGVAGLLAVVAVGASSGDSS